eukprot:GHVS01091328.1.p1 GENE.GHVS01091328.1~~GHVS01091328.1.p1  ORF type:complete len:559 (+),score=73.26 GHVS01091328.1:67-1743(+)
MFHACFKYQGSCSQDLFPRLSVFLSVQDLLIMCERDNDSDESLGVPCRASKVHGTKAATGGKSRKERLGNSLYVIPKGSYTGNYNARFAAMPDKLDRLKEPLAYCSKPHNYNLLSHDDKVVLCFFDPLHELRESKYKKHLLSCKAKKQQLPGKDYFMCKYNSVHFYRSVADKELHEMHYCKERGLGGHRDDIWVDKSWEPFDDEEETCKKKSTGGSPRRRLLRLCELDPKAEEEESSDSSCRGSQHNKEREKTEAVASYGAPSNGSFYSCREPRKTAVTEWRKDSRNNDSTHNSKGMDGKCQTAKCRGGFERAESRGMSYPVQADYRERNFSIDRRKDARQTKASGDAVVCPSSTSSSPIDSSSSSSSSSTTTSSDESDAARGNMRARVGAARQTSSAGLHARHPLEREQPHRRASSGRRGEGARSESQLPERGTRDGQMYGRESQQRKKCQQSPVIMVHTRTQVYSSSEAGEEKSRLHGPDERKRSNEKHHHKKRSEIREVTGQSPSRTEVVKCPGERPQEICEVGWWKKRQPGTVSYRTQGNYMEEPDSPPNMEPL